MKIKATTRREWIVQYFLKSSTTWWQVTRSFLLPVSTKPKLPLATTFPEVTPRDCAKKIGPTDGFTFGKTSFFRRTAPGGKIGIVSCFLLDCQKRCKPLSGRGCVISSRSVFWLHRGWDAVCLYRARGLRSNPDNRSSPPVPRAACVYVFSVSQFEIWAS